METTSTRITLINVPLFELKEPGTHVLFVCSQARCPPNGDVLIRGKFLEKLSNILLLPEAQVCSDLKSAIRLMRHSPLGRHGEFVAKKIAEEANALSLEHKCKPMIIFYSRQF